VSARRSQILEESARLFAAKGFAATTVREISDAVGMQSGSLYKYFSSKDDIVAQLLFAYLDEELAACEAVLATEQPAGTRLTALVETTFRTMVDHRHSCEIAQSDERLLLDLAATADLRERSEVIRRSWSEVIEAAIEEGSVRADVDVHAAYWFIRGAMWFTVRWFDADGPITVESLIDQFTEFIKSGYERRT
jgi:AcrR family transcriptional regulator